jgi:hypothetical protein
LVWAGRWSLVFALNLPVAAFYGWALTERSGRLGMMAATAALWAAGLVACSRPGRLRLALVIGALPIAATQLLPILQIVAGSFALSAWSSLIRLPETAGFDAPLSEAGGFAVTLLTGLPLMAAALAVGSITCWALDWVNGGEFFAKVPVGQNPNP